MKRYKLIGDKMFERAKGDWVRWDDVKPFVEGEAIIPTTFDASGGTSATNSDNKRNRE